MPRPAVVLFALASVAFPAAPVLAQAGAPAEELTQAEAQRIASYASYWDLVHVAETAPPEERARRDEAIRGARAMWQGRGPALARHFLASPPGSASNSAFFFLFRAAGDVSTATLLIEALPDPPQPSGGGLARDPGEIAVAVESMLRDDAIRAAPAVTASLQQALGVVRPRPGGGPTAALLIELLGRSGTAAALETLKGLARDPDPVVRAEALKALGRTGDPAAAPTLVEKLQADPDAAARANAAAAVPGAAVTSASATLRSALDRETSPEVVDAIVRSLEAIGALPAEPAACLAMANRVWDPDIARPLYTCWAATAIPTDLVTQATAAQWTVRALALETLARGPAPTPDVRERLLASAAEVLSNAISGVPAADSVSEGTAARAREAIWELSGRDMGVALATAGRVTPVSGRNPAVGQYGISLHLAARDAQEYARQRRPWQWIAAAAAAALTALLLLVRPLRPFAVSILLAIGLWTAWFSFQTDVRALPPLRLAFLTPSFIGLLVGGVVAGLATLFRTSRWVALLVLPITAAALAFTVSAVTRVQGWFPVGAAGWDLLADAIASALFAAPAALAASVIFLRRFR